MKAAQLGFIGGEFSYPMYGRPDDSSYAYGLGRARNFLIRPQGTLRARPGFEFVTEAKYPARKCRLIPFQYSATDTAVIEMGHQYMRFMVNGAVVLNDRDQPYEISTPYNEADLFAVHYDQSADVMTFAHTSYSPMTLKRYGPNDWRLETLDLGMKIKPPTDVEASAYYPDINGDNNKGSFGYEEEDKDRVTSTYCVTAVDSDGNESERSETATTKGNFYITGAYNTITWKEVSGAKRYKVYRETGGIYGFIGETETTSIKDDNISPDTTVTPPAYAEFFSASGGIKQVTVTNGGSGYYDGQSYYTLPSTLRIPVIYGWAVTKEGGVLGGELPDTLSLTLTVSEKDGSYPVTGTVGLTLNDDKDYYLPDNVVAVGSSPYTGSYINVALSANEHRYFNPRVYLQSPSVGGYVFTYEPKSGVSIGAAAAAAVAGGSQAAKDMISTAGASLAKVSGYTRQGLTPISLGNTTLTVTDSTGTGASLKPVISDGVITGVIVVSAGQNYTKPTVTASGGGSGAKFSVTLFSGDEIQAPGALGLFEQRRWFAGTGERPLSIIATKSGTTDEMSRHYPNQNVDDCIVVQAETRDANRILHLVPLQDLIMFTSSAEWRISASDGGAITPVNISVKPQSYYGCTEVQPVIASNQCLYATARGGHIREMGYSRDVYGYLSSDISVRATHLFDGYKIDDMCYMKAPFPRLACVSSSGLIANCTYMPEQSLQAWSSFSTDGIFESCASIPEGGDDGEDSLYVVVRRVIEGQVVHYIERMGIIEDNTDMSLCLDSCLTGQFPTPQTVIGGLQHLEGKTVGAQCDGNSIKDLTVKNGQVTLPKPASNIVIGLPIDYSVLTLPFITQIQGYGKGRVKNIGKVYVQVLYDGELSAGPTDGQQVTLTGEFLNRYSDEPSEPAVREISAVMRGKWSELTQMLIKHTDYKPVEITSWTADVEIGG